MATAAGDRSEAAALIPDVVASLQSVELHLTLIVIIVLTIKNSIESGGSKSMRLSVKALQLSVGLFCFVASALPAAADWQYTRWNMTPDQVMSASKGQLKRCALGCPGQSSPKYDALLEGEYQSGEFRFKVYALFEKGTNKLSLMHLNLLQPDQAYSLIGALTTKYGKPVDGSQSQISKLSIWRDKSDQISVFVIGYQTPKSATLSYQPRLTDSNKGL